MKTEVAGQRKQGRKLGIRILAVFMAILLVMGVAGTLATNIRFSRLKFVREVAAEAAAVTEENTQYLSDSRLERAWKVLKATVRKPETYDEYELYASIAIAREEYGQATEYLRGCIDTCQGTNLDLSVLYLRLGSLFILQNEDEKALPELTNALELNPSLAAAAYLRAQIYTDQGETEKALEDFRTYCRQSGSDPQIVGQLAKAFEQAGDTETAFQCYTRAIEYGTEENADLYLGRARCEILQENVLSAKVDLEKYFSLTTEDPEGKAAAMLASCLMDLEDYEGAAEKFRQAVDLGYEDPSLLLEHSMMCWYQIGQYEKASQDGNQAIEAAKAAGKDKTDLHFWTGMAYMGQEKYPEAEARLREAAEMDSQMEEIQYYMGVALMAQEKYQEAVDAFGEAIEKEQNQAASRYNRAICYIQTQRYSEAEEDLLQIEETDEDPELTAQAKELLKELQQAQAQEQE